MKHEIKIFVDSIYYKNEEITDPVRIAKVIRSHISYLGEFSIYIKPKPKTFWEKLIRSLASGY